MDETFRAVLSISLVADILEKGIEMPLFPLGMSMMPFILDGEKVIVRRTEPEKIRVGSIIAFRDQTKSWIILHRVIEVSQTTKQVLTMGDCQLYPEAVEATDVLGEVIRVEKDGLILNMENLRARICNYLIAKNSLLFYVLHFWSQKLQLQRFGLRGILLRTRLAVPFLALTSLRCLAALEYFWRQRLSIRKYP